jgi:phosphoglycolate phosphatase (TIGR01487 family)
VQFAAFAFDYDGTLAYQGRVAEETVQALRRLKAAGLRLLLVTGRRLPDLHRVFPHFSLFDVIVAENGAVLSWPALGDERSLGPAPPAALLEALRRRCVQPLEVGRSILATCQANESEMLAAIRECGLEWQIISNNEAVMCLPPGVDKASGLRVALETLDLSPLAVLGVGDAENDQAMLNACGYSVAVANAIDALKAAADLVTRAKYGEGVAELIDTFLGRRPTA